MHCVVILISADYEWRSVHTYFRSPRIDKSPYGEWFNIDIRELDSLQGATSSIVDNQQVQIVFFQGGWGKIAAAGSTQYIIDRWAPEIIVNLGTCGGFKGKVERGEIILVEKTIVYDIFEQMGDFDEHITAYTTTIDLSRLKKPWPIPVRQTLLVSGDRDLIDKEIPFLHERYGAVAGDWESGAIAWVANRNHTRLLILRGVTDLVGIDGGEAYGNIEAFASATQKIMNILVSSLSGWLRSAGILPSL